MNARELIEAEDPKSVFSEIKKGPQFKPRPLTPRERERLANILAMGPLKKKPIDDRFLNWGYIEYYGDYEPGDPEFQQAVDAKAGFAKAFYTDPNILGAVGPEWMDLPGEYKKHGRKFHWRPRQEAKENPQSVLKAAAAAQPREEAEVTSSGGKFVIDNVSGRVLQWLPDDPNDEDYKGYAEIDRFDLAEWRTYWRWEGDMPGGYDILDLGFWCHDGTYEPPEQDFREEIAALDDDEDEQIEEGLDERASGSPGTADGTASKADSLGGAIPPSPTKNSC